MSTCGRIICGEMHYPRIPRAYWRERLRMARAMGLDAVSTYVFWNRHEPQPGTFDFEGENDVAAYLRAAQEEALHVVLRPGPYVCAEWDFGGLPSWLLRDGKIAVRTSQEAFMAPVRRWLGRLGREIQSLHAAHGGPIVAVQLENEYGAFAADPAYLAALRAALVDSGFGESPLFTIDQPNDLARGSMPDVAIAATFAPGRSEESFQALSEHRPGAAPIAGEYWAGWFDHWGETRDPLPVAVQTEELAHMLRAGASVNIYMFHGGTNFGFWNGANSAEGHPFQPTTTSYDYEAALDESGRPTAKYFAFREAIASTTGVTPPPVPLEPRVMAIDEFVLDESADPRVCAEPVLTSGKPRAMEEFGQAFGFAAYTTELAGPVAGVLEAEYVRDFACVSVNGIVAGYLDRRLGIANLRIECGDARVRLEIFVENCGRINYGPDLPGERKGVFGRVVLDGEELFGWTIAPLPFERAPAHARFSPGVRTAPAIYRGAFEVDECASTFIDTRGLGKGTLWINGRNAGRFWNIGPQYSLYVPGPWLKIGRNEAIVLDLLPREDVPRLRGVTERVH